MNEIKDISKLSIDQAKVLYFDTAKTIQQAQTNLQQLEDHINKLEG